MNTTSAHTIDRAQDNPQTQDFISVLELQGLDKTMDKLLNGSCISLQSVVEEER